MSNYYSAETDGRKRKEKNHFISLSLSQQHKNGKKIVDKWREREREREREKERTEKNPSLSFLDGIIEVSSGVCPIKCGLYIHYNLREGSFAAPVLFCPKTAYLTF